MLPAKLDLTQFPSHTDTANGQSHCHVCCPKADDLQEVSLQMLSSRAWGRDPILPVTCCSQQTGFMLLFCSGEGATKFQTFVSKIIPHLLLNRPNTLLGNQKLDSTQEGFKNRSERSSNLGRPKHQPSPPDITLTSWGPGCPSSLPTPCFSKEVLSFLLGTNPEPSKHPMNFKAMGYGSHESSS